MPADTTVTPKVWPVKHSPLLRAPERFVSRDEIRGLIQDVTGASDEEPLPPAIEGGSLAS